MSCVNPLQVGHYCMICFYHVVITLTRWLNPQGLEPIYTVTYVILSRNSYPSPDTVLTFPILYILWYLLCCVSRVYVTLYTMCTFVVTILMHTVLYLF